MHGLPQTRYARQYRNSCYDRPQHLHIQLHVVTGHRSWVRVNTGVNVDGSGHRTSLPALSGRRQRRKQHVTRGRPRRAREPVASDIRGPRPAARRRVLVRVRA